MTRPTRPFVSPFSHRPGVPCSFILALTNSFVDGDGDGGELNKGYHRIRYLPYIFPPHTGNDLDWSLKASDDLQLDGVEFGSLPSGLHLLEQDVILHEGRPARRCAFLPSARHPSKANAASVSSLGTLLARSLRPRPWRHVPALKALVRDFHSDSATQGDSSQGVWEPTRGFFELRKTRLEDLGGWRVT
ncbi:hypothetical protein EDB86DRAFT_3159424 [Lactarius hatsudake]|nr:hypothetical protein EDB86DRAFT_3159424 [Lactarius hatsudake]